MLKTVLAYLPQMKKALVPVLVGGALTLLGYVGVTGDMTVREVVVLAVTGVLTWLVRNSAKWFGK